MSYLKTCPVCRCEFVSKRADRRTCSSPCAKVLEAASWWFYDDDYAEGRLSLAQSILNHSSAHSPSQVRWASRMVDFFLRTGGVAAPKTRYLQRNSNARRVMEQNLSPERMAEIIQEATRETVDP